MDCRLAHRSDSLVTYHKETKITATAVLGRPFFLFLEPAIHVHFDVGPHAQPSGGWEESKEGDNRDRISL